MCTSYVLAHKATAQDFLEELSVAQQDNAYTAICAVILAKVPLPEPFESTEGHEYDVTFEEIRDICDLLAKITSDASIYTIVQKIADTFVAAERRHKFSAAANLRHNRPS